MGQVVHAGSACIGLLRGRQIRTNTHAGYRPRRRAPCHRRRAAVARTGNPAARRQHRTAHVYQRIRQRRWPVARAPQLNMVEDVARVAAKIPPRHAYSAIGRNAASAASLPHAAGSRCPVLPCEFFASGRSPTSRHSEAAHTVGKPLETTRAHRSLARERLARCYLQRQGIRLSGPESSMTQHRGGQTLWRSAAHASMRRFIWRRRPGRVP